MPSSKLSRAATDRESETWGLCVTSTSPPATWSSPSPIMSTRSMPSPTGVSILCYVCLTCAYVRRDFQWSSPPSNIGPEWPSPESVRDRVRIRLDWTVDDQNSTFSPGRHSFRRAGHAYRTVVQPQIEICDRALKGETTPPRHSHHWGFAESAIIAGFCDHVWERGIRESKDSNDIWHRMKEAGCVPRRHRNIVHSAPSDRILTPLPA
jgi:hypothetical protein